MIKKYFLFGLLTLFCGVAWGTNNNEFPYDTVPGDPLHGRVYHLANGLTVFISVNNAEPKIQTLIAVKAGSKYDPSDATGLAHYLEHMLFKGTTHYGTSDYAKEKPLLDKIENLFELYRHTTDEHKRERIYRQIDSVSYAASTYAIPNEYNKMMNFIGSEGTNAETSEDKTIFQENIPSNELDAWLQIESDRFKNPVMRLFHTELEVVYEEKNMRMDNGSDLTYEALMNGLFPGHPYGTHTTIGTIHDLKNPSLKDIISYFHKYYVPNNMVITLCGDVDPDEAIQKVNAWFGSYLSHAVPSFICPREDSITKPVVKTVVDQHTRSVEIGYGFGGAVTEETDMVRLIQKLLYNGKTGLLEQDMAGKLDDARANVKILKDHSVLFLSANPKDDQTLEQVKDSLLKEIQKLTTGNFPQWLVEGAVNNMRVDEMNDFHSNMERGKRFVEAFATDESWSSSINRINRISKITKDDIIKFAKNNFKNNYVIVYKKRGPEEQVERIKKPPITPVQINTNSESDFLKKIEDEKPQPLQPVFADYAHKVKQYELQQGIDLYCVKNTEDSIFDLSYIFDLGNSNNRNIKYALQYFYYGSTSYFSSYQIKQEFFRMGCSLTYRVDYTTTTVELKGLSKNFIQAFNLMESMFNDIMVGKQGWDKVTKSMVEGRDYSKKDWNSIFYSFTMYALYGASSPFTYVLSDEQIKGLEPGRIQNIIRKIRTRPHTITYYGPMDGPHLIASLQQYHRLPPDIIQPAKPATFKSWPVTNNVYIYNTDIRQAQVLIYQPGIKYSLKMQPVISLYNQYFSGSLESPFWQTLRESKALAYSVSSTYIQPTESSDTGYNYTMFYTQADKLPSAINVAMQLLNDTLTYNPQLLLASKDAVMKSICSERVNRGDFLTGYLKAGKLGIEYDINKDVFETVPNLTFDDIKDFHTKYIAGQLCNIVIVGNAQLMDLSILRKYGKIIYLKQEDLFGF